MRAEPVAYDAWFFLGTLYLEQKKSEAALDAFAKASEILPLRQEPLFELGRIDIGAKEPTKAKACFDRYISLGGDEARVKEIIK